MILEKNNMHEFDTFNIFKWIFKTFVATYLLTNCFTIVMAVFDVAQNVVSQSAGVINGNLDVQAALSDLETQLEAMGMWELIGLWLETNIINLCMWVLSIVIFVIVYGRMIEIYLTVSLAPIPFSTMANREWGQMGTGYLRSLFALGFQGFLILICVAIYAVLVQSISNSCPSTSSLPQSCHAAAVETAHLPFSCAAGNRPSRSTAGYTASYSPQYRMAVIPQVSQRLSADPSAWLQKAGTSALAPSSCRKADRSASSCRPVTGTSERTETSG